MKKMHTPGPWNWFERADGTIYLATPDRGHLCVMDAGSTGVGGSQPRLAVWDGEQRGRQGGVMRTFIEAGGPFHPDACLIGAAPLLLEALVIARDYAAYAQAEPGDLALIDAAIAKATGERG